MRIGHCQLDSQLGEFDGNLQKVVAGLERADRQQVDIPARGGTRALSGFRVVRDLW